MNVQTTKETKEMIIQYIVTFLCIALVVYNTNIPNKIELLVFVLSLEWLMFCGEYYDRKRKEWEEEEEEK